MLWPEPDLPRTSTGKVRRQPITEWVAKQAAENGADSASRATTTRTERNGDWLHALVAEISGEHPLGEDDLRLGEDFHLDSLGRVQLAAALEERLTDAPTEGSVDAAKTLGDLRRIAVGARGGELTRRSSTVGHPEQEEVLDRGVSITNTTSSTSPLADFAPGDEAEASTPAMPSPNSRATSFEKREFKYPFWPWWRPFQWLRAAFLELIAQPLIWFLAAPRVLPRELGADEPMLITCNHVTAYDGALVEYALPGRMRRWVAAAMLGEMLEDFRHFRDPDTRRFMLFGPAAYWLLTALYNVFPLPKRQGFQRSFAHAGEAMDRGYSVLVFPEGTRSEMGQLAPFRPGIGLLVKQTHAPVLPMAILGLGELKGRGRGWFRSGKIEIRMGEPIRFDPIESEAAITEALHAKVAALMEANQIDMTNV
jgi:long-chain acyl-CoA synthetase